MGCRRGRGAALTPALAATLARVADAMRGARDRWWVIGSAAVVLHGGETRAGDVDVLLSADDATALAGRLGLSATPGGGHPLFRSAVFLAWAGAPLPVEFMAGFEVAIDAGWLPVTLRTRVSVAVEGGVVFVPDRSEMRALLARFGRAKDLERIAVLG